MNLVLRFYDVQGGRITLDGVDIVRMDRRPLRENFGVVLQDTWLFNGTIGENTAYGAQRATEEQIIAAAEAAFVDHIVPTLPDGHDTRPPPVHDPRRPPHRGDGGRPHRRAGHAPLAAGRRGSVRAPVLGPVLGPTA
jgi:hypothetical protein